MGYLTGLREVSHVQLARPLGHAHGEPQQLAAGERLPALDVHARGSVAVGRDGGGADRIQGGTVRSVEGVRRQPYRLGRHSARGHGAAKHDLPTPPQRAGEGQHAVHLRHRGQAAGSGSQRSGTQLDHSGGLGSLACARVVAGARRSIGLGPRGILSGLFGLARGFGADRLLARARLRHPAGRFGLGRALRLLLGTRPGRLPCGVGVRGRSLGPGCLAPGALGRVRRDRLRLDLLPTQALGGGRRLARDLPAQPLGRLARVLPLAAQHQEGRNGRDGQRGRTTDDGDRCLARGWLGGGGHRG